MAFNKCGCRPSRLFKDMPIPEQDRLLEFYGTAMNEYPHGWDEKCPNLDQKV